MIEWAGIIKRINTSFVKYVSFCLGDEIVGVRCAGKYIKKAFVIKKFIPCINLIFFQVTPAVYIYINLFISIVLYVSVSCIAVDL